MVIVHGKNNHLDLAVKTKAVAVIVGIILRIMREDAAACSADKPPLRLVLFSARRTGSSLFVNLMRQHPRMLMHGEVRGACTAAASLAAQLTLISLTTLRRYFTCES